MNKLPDKSSFPPELLDAGRFIIWFEERRGDKHTKIPAAPWRTGHYKSASATDPENWADFETAIKYARRKEGYGLGFCFSDEDEIIGIDLDNCINEKSEVEDWALDIINSTSSYAELSPSGRGIHILLKGEIPGAIKESEVGVEAYGSGRYFTLTGRRLKRREELEEDQELLDKLWKRYGEKLPEIKREPREASLDLQITGLFDLGLLDKSKFRKSGNSLRGSHPIHGSTTGTNLAINPRRNIWFCHRHECGGGALELLAILEGIITCGSWERGESPLRGEKWIRTVEAARRRGYLTEGKFKKLIGRRREELGEKEYRKIAEELAKGDITEKYLGVFGKTVKEEKRLVELGLYHLLSAYTPDPINLGLEAPTSEGKTYPIVEVARRFPKEDVWFLGGLSPTALAHDYGELVDKVTGEPLAPKLSKLYERLGEADDMEEKRKIKKTIKNLHKRGKYRIDLEGRIIIFLEPPAPETFERLRPILSHDTPEVNYKFTDRKFKGGPLGQVTTTLRGWPVAVFFKARRSRRDSWFWDQIESRFTTISPKMDSEKYRAAVKFMARRKGLPSPILERELKLSDFEKLEKEIRAIRRRLREITEKTREKSRISPPNIFWIPFREQIGEAFPAKAGRHMRDSQRFLTALQMSAAINVFNRPILEIDGAEYIIVTRRDYDRVVDLYFGEGSETIFTGIPGHVTEFFRKVIIPLWDEERGIPPEGAQTKLDESEEEAPIGVTTAQMVRKCRKVYEKPISGKTLSNHYLPILEDAGVITKEVDPEDRRRYLFRVLRREIFPEIIPVYSLFENGNNFTEELLKEELRRLGQIFPQRISVHGDPITVEKLWRDFFTHGDSSGNINRRKNRGSSSGKEDEIIPVSKTGLIGNNSEGLKPSKAVSDLSVFDIKNRLWKAFGVRPFKASELTKHFSDDKLERVNNVILKMKEDGEIRQVPMESDITVWELTPKE